MAKDIDKKNENKSAGSTQPSRARDEPEGSTIDTESDRVAGTVERQLSDTETVPRSVSGSDSVGIERKVGTALAHLQRLMEISGPLVVKLAHAAADTIMHGESPYDIFDALEAMLAELGGGDHMVHAQAARAALA